MIKSAYIKREVGLPADRQIASPGKPFIVRQPLGLARLMTLADITSCSFNIATEAAWLLLQPDYNWIWCYEEPSGAISALLIAAPCHGVPMLLRLVVAPNLQGQEASLLPLVSLFRKSLADISSRGYKAYWTILDPERPTELRLINLASKAGGLIVSKGVIVAGPTDPEGKLEQGSLSREAEDA